MSADWVPVVVAANEIEADLIAGLLDEAEIPHAAIPTMSAPGAWLTGTRNANDPIRVMVPADRLAEASALLDVGSSAPVPDAEKGAGEDAGWGPWAILIAILLAALIFFSFQADTIGGGP